jgi:hypothetical protein
MKIIQHADCFEVRSGHGTFVRRFPFEDNARRRATSKRMSRKQAFQSAKTFAGKSYTVETAKQQDWNFAAARLPKRHA